MIQVKLFDAGHELDLEEEINLFLKDIPEQDILSIDYQTEFLDGGDHDTIYSYSAMVVYKMNKKEEN